MNRVTHTDAKVLTTTDMLSAAQSDKLVMLNTLVLLVGPVVLIMSIKIMSGF